MSYSVLVKWTKKQEEHQYIIPLEFNEEAMAAVVVDNVKMHITYVKELAYRNNYIEVLKDARDEPWFAMLPKRFIRTISTEILFSKSNINVYADSGQEFIFFTPWTANNVSNVDINVIKNKS
jgi:hypothetical protein